ncbi:fatty-acid--CoA ligase FadD4 [Mycolicibacterium sp.]|uniref:fatty-acid--CoA ligase FadD4 n=1 Tax=Mycolicibacterium sp. TaxID=2320850 RepID=UPI0037CBC377
MHIRDHVEADRPAIVLVPSGATVRYAELDARANQLAHFLRQSGLAAGDTVAILMENNAHVHAAMWAARRSGLYFTIINTHLTAPEIGYIVEDCQAKALVSSHAMVGMCRELDNHVNHGLPRVRVMADEDLDGWQRYPNCVAYQSTSPIEDESDGQLLQYSAGSTGRPKGIRRPLRSAGGGLSSLSTPVFEALGIDSGSVYLSPAPTYHTAPAMWTMAAQAAGATTIVMEHFDPVLALEAIEQYGVTHAQFVPTMFVRMLRLPDDVRRRYDVSTLRRVVHAAAPCPPEIKAQMIDWWGPIIDEYYGSSEGAGICYIRAEEWLEHPGSVGKPLLGTPHVLGPDGAELPAGEIGDLYFEGGYPFEYLNDAVKTAASRSSEGWVTVGDVGYLDHDGYVYLTDRRNHMIISGGVNVYPQEAENALLSHPLVVDAAVFGIPDADLGQTVKAVVELVDPVNISDETAERLMAWLHERLASYKCPRSISFSERLPRTDAGKLNKQRLIEMYG